MGVIKSSRTLFFTTSPRSPKKLIPEIALLVDNFSGQTWSGNEQVQEEFARTLAAATTFEGDTSKKYSAFSARDRITRSPQGLGFVDLSPTIQLTEAGESFIHGNRPHEIFLRQLLKFQLPSPYHKEGSKIKGIFWGRPYLEIIRLIRDLDHLTPDEFRIFALQLTDYRNYETVRNQIIAFREEKEKHKGQYKRFVDDVINREISKIYAAEIESGNIATRESKTSDVRSFISKEKRNMRDYADACFRYFRFTEMFVSDGRSIQIAPDKIPEIDFILETVPREPTHIDNVTAFKNYLFDPAQPRLYTDDRSNLEDTLMRHFSYTKRELSGKTIEELKDLRDSAVQAKRVAIIQKQTEELKSYALYQEVIDTYNEILSDEVYDAPLFLEWNTWRAMTMLDGGTIKGNFKIDDSGRPTSTAQGNMPDIECDYDTFALSVEVTLQRGQRQYESEGEPVTRHYAQLQKSTGKNTYCLFIAPSINRATWAHFFGLNQIRNIAAYGGKPKIIPLELDSFMRLIENSYTSEGIPKPQDVQKFLQTAIDEVENSTDEIDWGNRISAYVDKWLVA